VSASTITPSLQDTVENATAVDAEWRLLLAACSQLPREEKQALFESFRNAVQWNRVWELADRHNLQPLLYEALANAGNLIPSREMKVLEKLHQTNIHKSLLVARELVRIAAHLAEAGIEAIPYKGVALAQFLYGDIALRQAGDIDLLIRSRDLPRVRSSLRELGYAPHVSFSPAQERAYLKAGYECAFDGAAGPNLLEVQWAVQPRFYAVDLPQDELFHRAMTFTVAGHRINALSPEDLFIVLSLHAAKHLWGRLIWVCDLAQIVNLPTLNWDWIAKQSKKLGIVRILRIGLLLAHRLLQAEIPNQADALGEDAVAPLLALKIERDIKDSSVCDPESLAYFKMMLRIRERPTDRLRFVTRLAFTSGPGEWTTIRLPGPLFPLYHLVRFYRLGRKMVTS
jgi:hypothetical protein